MKGKKEEARNPYCPPGGSQTVFFTYTTSLNGGKARKQKTTEEEKRELQLQGEPVAGNKHQVGRQKKVCYKCPAGLEGGTKGLLVGKARESDKNYILGGFSTKWRGSQGGNSREGEGPYSGHPERAMGGGGDRDKNRTGKGFTENTEKFFPTDLANIPRTGHTAVIDQKYTAWFQTIRREHVTLNEGKKAKTPSG